MANSLYPCLWFQGEAMQAAMFYCSIFPNSEITDSNQWVVRCQLNGATVMCLNGRKRFEFNEAMSLVVECENQTEIDHYWDRLTEGGAAGQCGWLKDRYGVSWQIVPVVLSELMGDPEKSPVVVERFLKMSKFDIEALKAGWDK